MSRDPGSKDNHNQDEKTSAKAHTHSPNNSREEMKEKNHIQQHDAATSDRQGSFQISHQRVDI
jgi:hypothetical protein